MHGTVLWPVDLGQQSVGGPTPKPRRDETLVKALVRANRWRRQIESGRVKSIARPY
jgi:hypothetical protein